MAPSTLMLIFTTTHFFRLSDDLRRTNVNTKYPGGCLARSLGDTLLARGSDYPIIPLRILSTRPLRMMKRITVKLWEGLERDLKSEEATETSDRDIPDLHPAAANVRSGSFATNLAQPPCPLISASLRKRPNCRAAAK